jgi:hypothetical protein
MTFTNKTLFPFFCLLLLLAIPLSAQNPPALKAAPSPARQELDAFIARDSYVFYSEVRNVGQQARAHQVNEVFEAFKMLDSLPAEVAKVRHFLVAHSEELDSARAVIAFSPSRPGIPETLVAVEMESPEAATKLQPAIAKMLLSLSGKTPPKALPATRGKTARPETAAETQRRLEAQGVFLKIAGSIICVSDSKLELSALKPANSKLMLEDPLFQTARARFASDPLFVYYNQKVHERVSFQEQKERQETLEKEKAEAEKAAKVELETAKAGSDQKSDSSPESAKVEETPKQEESAVDDPSSTPDFEVREMKKVPSPTPSATPSPDQVAATRAFGSIFESMFRLGSRWPDAIAGALSFEGDDVVARAVMLSKDGEQTIPIPFLPFLITGHPGGTRAAAIAPADTDVFISASLDLPRIFDALLTPLPQEKRQETSQLRSDLGTGQTVEAKDEETPAPASPAKQVAVLELLLGFRIKEDLLAAFGNEVALAVRTQPRPAKSSDPSVKPESMQNFALLISLQNREAAQRMLPKVLELLGMKAVGQDATEHFEDIEITNYTSFSIAFVDDFLVISENNAAVKEVLESRTGQSLGSSNLYRSATLWQPQPRTAQVYLSQALTDTIFTQGTTVFDYAGDTGKAFVTRFRAEPRPISFSLTNDGNTQQHELHVPVAAILNWIGETTFASKYAEIIGNESTARSGVTAIAGAEKSYKESKGQGHYGTLEELIKSEVLPTYFQELKQYKFQLTVSGEDFEATATPVEYGSKGRSSFFMDQSGVLRGGDLGGRRANASDPIVKAEGRKAGLF